MASTHIAALVLAAGASTRMGGENKLLLTYNGVSMVRRVVEQVRASRVGETIVVLGYEADRVRQVLEGLDVHFVVHDRFEQGMASSVAAGVLAASRRADGFMVVLGDLPLIRTVDINGVIEPFDRHRREDERLIVRAERQGRPAHPVIFNAAYRDELGCMDSEDGARNLVRANRDHLINVPMLHDGVFRDVDTPESFNSLEGEV